jgi:hypothetical protein
MAGGEDFECSQNKCMSEYIVSTFVNVTVYLQHNNNMLIKNFLKKCEFQNRKKIIHAFILK